MKKVLTMFIYYDTISLSSGEMSELAKEPVLKTGEPARGLGSSPSLIAIYGELGEWSNPLPC